MFCANTERQLAMTSNISTVVWTERRITLRCVPCNTRCIKEDFYGRPQIASNHRQINLRNLWMAL